MSGDFPEMNDFSAGAVPGAPLPEDEQMVWARVQLDFGPSGIELDDAEAVDSEGDDVAAPMERIRQELEQMIGAIRDAQVQAQAQDRLGEDDVARMESLLNESGKLEELVAQVTEEERQKDAEATFGGPDGAGGPGEPAEGAEVTEAASESEPGTETVDKLEPPADEDAEREAEELAERERLDAEIEQRIVETTAEDVINALMLVGLDLAEVLLHETLEDSVNLYVLCTVDGDSLRTVHMDDSGELTYGSEFYGFVDELLEELPVRGGICADQFSYSYTAPVTALGEELALSADGTCAALVEAPMSDLPAFVGEAVLAGPVYAAPADNGWSLIATDPVSLGNLLSLMRVPSIVAESAEGMKHLAFVFPGSTQNFGDGTVGQWLSQTVGTTPDSDDMGTVIEFAWGAPKVLMRFIPQGSRALDYLWLLPGVLPEPIESVRAMEDVDNLTWLYGLDEQTANRFSNYVFDASSETGMESVVQVLRLPEELVKAVADSTVMADFVGFREFTPNMTGMELLKESVTAYPNGTDPLSKINRKLMACPWAIAADGAVQLGASGALAVWAARRVARGQSGRGQAMVAATLGAAGIAELVLARVYGRLKEANMVGESEPAQVSLLDELKQAQQAQAEAETGQGAQATAEAANPQQVALVHARELGERVLGKTQNLGEKARNRARGAVRRFFGS